MAGETEQRNRVILEMKDVHANYGLVRALQGMSLHISQGEIVALIGANGAGKSTTLRTICGVLPPVKGEIIFQGQPLRGITPEKAVALGITCVDERRLLFPSMSVLDNLILGAYHRHSKDEIKSDFQTIFQLFPILKEREKQIVGTLSGGEQQMLAIGRALMARPRLLLLDQPLLGLTPALIGEIMKMFIKLKNRGVTILVVEQNVRAILNIADRGYVIEEGRTILEGCSNELLLNEGVRSRFIWRKDRD